MLNVCHFGTAKIYTKYAIFIHFMNKKLLTIYKLLKMKGIRPVNKMVFNKINGRAEYL
jgi:hypothetical protein